MPDPLSAADIAEGHRLDAAATSGTWSVVYDSDGDEYEDYGTWPCALIGPKSACSWREENRVTEINELSDADAELIVWVRNRLPALLDAAEKVAELDYQQAMRLAEHGPGRSPQERWREASRAARASEQHWPADCLAEAADVHDSLIQERAAVRALANRWANQSNDYDEDTEQQIADGREILALLGEEVDSGE